VTVLRFVRKWSWEFASLAVVLAGVVAYLLIRALSPTHDGLTPGERVKTPDARVSFTAPQGWDRSSCSYDPSGECVEVSPAHAGDGDVITASLLTGPVSTEGDSPLAVLSLPELPPGAQRITVDGVAAVRFDGAQGGTDKMVVVFAILPSEDLFTLECVYDHRESEIREGCDMIIDTLSLRGLSAAGEYRPE
jgi:hypothetical protein